LNKTYATSRISGQEPETKEIIKPTLQRGVISTRSAYAARFTFAHLACCAAASRRHLYQQVTLMPYESRLAMVEVAL
jgi:hypothetical protein